MQRNISETRKTRKMKSRNGNTNTVSKINAQGSRDHIGSRVSSHTNFLSAKSPYSKDCKMGLVAPAQALTKSNYYNTEYPHCQSALTHYS